MNTLLIISTLILVGQIYCGPSGTADRIVALSRRTSPRPDTERPAPGSDKEKVLTRSDFSRYLPKKPARPNARRERNGLSGAGGLRGADGPRGADGADPVGCQTDFLSRFYSEGFNAEPRDRFSSTLKCPPNSYVSSCECSVPHVCHGVTIDGDAADGCRVHSNGFSDREDGAKPILKCREKFNIEDISVITTTHANSQIRCPTGYVMDNCYVKDQTSLEAGKVELVKKVFGAVELSCGYQYVPGTGPIPRSKFGKVYGVCLKYRL